MTSFSWSFWAGHRSVPTISEYIGYQSRLGWLDHSRNCILPMSLVHVALSVLSDYGFVDEWIWKWEDRKLLKKYPGLRNKE